MGAQEQLESGPYTVCWATAPAANRQELRAALADQARRGEIQILSGDRMSRRLYSVPYVRLAPDSTRQRFWRRTLLIGGSIGVYALTAAVMLWEVRYFLLVVAGALLAATGIYYVLAHSGACPGLHCPCCKG